MILPREYTWTICIICANAKYIGRIQAPNQKIAIERAIKAFEITDVEQQKKRLMAQRGD
jgi:hypothetical protein